MSGANKTDVGDTCGDVLTIETLGTFALTATVATDFGELLIITGAGFVGKVDATLICCVVEKLFLLVRPVAVTVSVYVPSALSK
jgi:hypothetical protein